MSVVIVLSRATHAPKVIGPFATVDEAKGYGAVGLGHHAGWAHAADLWATVELEAPQAAPAPKPVA